ncbi:MAG: hypothetical protein QW406_05875, partial [Ignisphaera sp.]
MEMFTGSVFVYIFAKALDGDESSDPSYLGLPVDWSCILFGSTAAHGFTGITQISVDKGFSSDMGLYWLVSSPHLFSSASPLEVFRVIQGTPH